MRVQTHRFSVENFFNKYDVKPTSKNKINIQVRVWCLYAVPLNTGGNPLRRKFAN